MRKKYYRKKKRGPVVSKKVEYDGITFASGLEKYMYIALKAYERQANSKGIFKNRGSKRVLPIKYTPDFIGKDFIIETKGRPNESFPMRWKLFKRLVTQQFPNYTLFKPQNQKECDKVIEILKSQPSI